MQHDYILDNASGASFRADLNNVLKAIATCNAGTTQPTTTYEGMFWLNTSTNPPTLNMRNAANNGWYVLGTIDKLAGNKVKEGGGVGQLTNNVYIGWSGSRLKATVDVTDLGNIVFDSHFQASLGLNGYQKLPSGLIIQWGYVTVNNDSAATATFPVAFPNGVLNVSATAKSSTDTMDNFAFTTTNSNTILTVARGWVGAGLGENGAVFWLAIGY